MRVQFGAPKTPSLSGSPKDKALVERILQSAQRGSFGVFSTAETIGTGRARMKDFWAPGKTTKSARTLRNPNDHAGISEKNPTGAPVGFDIWWSWRDLKCHPKIFPALNISLINQ